MRRLAAASLFGLSLVAAAAPLSPVRAEDRPGHGAGAGKGQGKTSESLDDLMGAAPAAHAAPAAPAAEEGSSDDVPAPAPGSAGAGKPQPPATATPAHAHAAATAPAHVSPARAPASSPGAATGAASASPTAAPRREPPPARLTDDNDSSAAAPPPTQLAPVAADARPRVAGAYELGALDCRVLDGAGVERLLPKVITAGEEPDLLCRVIVTQPGNVAATAHTLTLTVHLGGKVTYQQVRNVRMSAVGRRAVLFVVPADRISSDDTTTQATLKVVLSAPAKPAAREVRFAVEQAD